FRMRYARQNCGIGDLVAVEVQDRQYRTICSRIEEFVRVPAGGQRASFSFAVADYAGHDEAGVVEGCTVCVYERVAKFAAFVDRAGSFRGDVAGNSVGPAELAEEALDAVAILLDVRVDLGVGTFKVGIRHEARTAVSRPNNVDHVEVAFFDEPG